MPVHHEGDDDIGALEEVDVGDSYNTTIKSDDFESEQKQRRSSVGPRNRCPYGCGKMIAARTIDYHRTNGCRPNQEEPFGDTSKKRFYCCGVCYTEFVTRSAFFEHLRTEHDVHAETHELSFRSMAHFQRFVRWIELEGGAHMRHKSGSKRRQRGKGIFMACNRSGFVNSNSVSGDPARDRTGPFRIGYTCTAYIHGTHHADGRVTIEMCGDHYGHDARMRLPQVVKYIIAQKQMEGEHNVDIIDYLRRHFMPFFAENIYAQRICLVDLEELRTLSVTSTKKWELLGIPSDCEIWEEELLDKAGIVREGVPRLRQLHEKTTQQIAEEENWPHPRVFTAKIRLPNGEFSPIENSARLNGEDELNTSRRRIVSNLSSQCSSLGASFMESTVFDDGAVSFMNMGTKRKRLSSGGDNMANGVNEDHKSLLDDLNHARDEFVDVESTTETSKNNSHGSFNKIGNGVEGEILKGMSPSKQFILNQLLNEVDIFKAQIKNSSSSIPARAIQALLLRVKSLRTSLDHPTPQALRGSSYRPGRIIMPSIHSVSGTNADGETSRAVYSIGGSDEGRFSRQYSANIKRESFEDLSDDEDIVLASGGSLQFNSNIWK